MQLKFSASSRNRDTPTTKDIFTIHRLPEKSSAKQENTDTFSRLCQRILYPRLPEKSSAKRENAATGFNLQWKFRFEGREVI